jgi:hypothetical protein
MTGQAVYSLHRVILEVQDQIDFGASKCKCEIPSQIEDETALTIAVKV